MPRAPRQPLRLPRHTDNETVLEDRGSVDLPATTGDGAGDLGVRWSLGKEVIAMATMTASTAAAAAPETAAPPAPGRLRSTVPSARVLRAINPFVSAILRSPVHRLLSGQVLLLTVTGRRSGRAYTFPVGYVREADTLTIVSGRHAWWKNLRGGAPVAVLLAGRQRTGRAEVIEDRAAVLAEMDRLMARYRPQGGRPADRRRARHHAPAHKGGPGPGHAGARGDPPHPGWCAGSGRRLTAAGAPTPPVEQVIGAHGALWACALSPERDPRAAEHRQDRGSVDLPVTPRSVAGNLRGR